MALLEKWQVIAIVAVVVIIFGLCFFFNLVSRKLKTRNASRPQTHPPVSPSTDSQVHSQSQSHTLTVPSRMHPIIVPDTSPHTPYSAHQPYASQYQLNGTQLPGQTHPISATQYTRPSPPPTTYHPHYTGISRHAHTQWPEQQSMETAPVPPQFSSDDLLSFDASGDDKKSPCPICLGPLEEEPISTGQCLHLMHTSCLKSWLVKDSRSACPICRLPYSDAVQSDRTGTIRFDTRDAPSSNAEAT